MRPAAIAAACFVLAAQEPTFQASTFVVVAPVTVATKDGKPVDGLTAADFQLIDNGRPVAFEADGYIPPIALAVAVETSSLSAAALVRVRNIGPMIEPLITGERGRASLIAYAGSVREVQEPTSDGAALKKAFASLKPAKASTGRMLDAIQLALMQFEGAPKDSRRVLLLIGESKDAGSEAMLRPVLSAAQRRNVLVYFVTYSRFLTPWATKAGDLPPTPCCNLFESLGELVRLGKENAAQVISRETGGRTYSFVTRNALEQAITHIGEELHSQYLLTFNAAADAGGAYHKLEVRVPRQPDLIVRTRPGYWMGE